MDYKFLNNIKSPDDVKKLNNEELKILCSEIRSCLISTVSHNGGHLASNLGSVELTVALHKNFDSPKDSILFDVGHQSYTHKLLTGRFDRFDTLRTEGGISGFMRPTESEHDPFVTGHSSNSISAAYGIYTAKALNGDNSYTVTVIGDGAMTGGMVYEGFNNASGGKNNFIVILNDNKMSISRNVGGLAKHLTVIRSKASYHRFKHLIKKALNSIPLVGCKISGKLFHSKTMLKNAIYNSTIFEEFGFNYLGPVDGHNLDDLDNIFKIAKSETRPVLIHVLTVKGKGYSFAENNPKFYHGVSKFNSELGINEEDKECFSTVAGNKLCCLAEKDEKICAITAAMTSGTGLTPFSKKFRNRFFDVGIAEEHAATFSGGLAIKGMKPYFFVYSSFLQRSYDQLIHDIAIAHLPVRLCIDRAGIVGEDGESHQGLFDVAFLSSIPQMTIYSPATYRELEQILEKSVDFDFPCAIRYPRGTELTNISTDMDCDYAVFGKGDTAIVTYGRIFANAIDVQKQIGNIAVIKLNKVYPLNANILKEIRKYKNVFFFEEGIKTGGIAEQLASMLIENNINVNYGINAIDNEFVLSATTNSALKKYGLDKNGMIKKIKGEI